MSKIKCQCCGTEGAEIPSSGRVGDTRKATGYSAIMNIRDGLSVMWVCPACVEALKPHIQAIVDKFGDQMQYLHFANMIDWVKK